MGLLVGMVGIIVALVAWAAWADHRRRRAGFRTLVGGWRSIRETRRDLHAADAAKYLTKDYRWTRRHRRGDGV
jgi:hypothetical protein